MGASPVTQTDGTARAFGLGGLAPDGSHAPTTAQAKSIDNEPAAQLEKQALAAFAGAFLGCFTTLTYSAFGVVPSIASALATVLLSGPFLLMPATGIVASAFFPAFYGGTFAGMTRMTWLGGDVGEPLTIPLFISLSVVCGLAFSVVAKLDGRSASPFGAGCGGRLGATAVVASFLFVELAGQSGGDVSRFHHVPVGAFSIQSWSALIGFFACLGGILSTSLALRRHAAAAGAAMRTFISSAVALIGLLTLHTGYPDNTDILDFFFAGCFLGMSTTERLKGWFEFLSGAVVLIGMLVLVRAFLPGLGGGLGLAAFASVAMLLAVMPPPRPAAALEPAWRFALPYLPLILVAVIASRIGVMGATLPLHDTTLNDVVTTSLSSPKEAAHRADQTGHSLLTTTTVSRPAAMVAGETCYNLTQSPQLLVGGPTATLRANEPAALGLTVDGAPEGAQLLICGFATKSIISAGRSIDEKTWTLPASEAGAALLIPPTGFVGVMKLDVVLLNLDKTIFDHKTLLLRWQSEEPVNPAPPTAISTADTQQSGPAVALPIAPVYVRGTVHEAASVDVEQRPSPSPAPQSFAPSQPTSPVQDPSGIAEKLRVGVEEMANGDIVAARMMFHRAAQAPNADGAFALAETYDPIVLSRMNLRGGGIKADVALARSWYEKARALGSTMAVDRITRLTQIQR
jgi:hypothetical protein